MLVLFRVPDSGPLFCYKYAFTTTPQRRAIFTSTLSRDTERLWRNFTRQNWVLSVSGNRVLTSLRPDTFADLVRCHIPQQTVSEFLRRTCTLTHDRRDFVQIEMLWAHYGKVVPFEVFEGIVVDLFVIYGDGVWKRGQNIIEKLKFYF